MTELETAPEVQSTAEPTIIIDWLGRPRTPEEIRTRNNDRLSCLSATLCMMYILTVIPLFIMLLIFSPANGASMSERFIIVLSFTCLLVGPLVIVVIGFIIFAIIDGLIRSWEVLA